MRRSVASLCLRLLAYSVPLLALVSLGTRWLFENERWISFGLASAAVSGLLLVASRVVANASLRSSRSPPPVSSWPDPGQRAWVDVDRIATRARAYPPSLGDAMAYQELFLEVLAAVGRHFHPTSRHPGLELTVAQTMEIVERALRDMRSEVVEALPLIRSLTLADVSWAHRQATQLGPAIVRSSQLAIVANRIRRWIVAWPVALANEVVNVLDISPIKAASTQASKIAVDHFVHHVGAYCIQAFSGVASLDISTLQSVAENAPIRILLVGPLNAGKSSLMNAMFGQERSKRDILPCPGLREEHVIDREGAPRAIILDSDGFGGAGHEAAGKRAVDETESADLVIAVTSAVQAARQPECQTLDEIRRRFAGSLRRTCPPILVAATHIDLLRPVQEWKPPYDLVDGETTKERNIRQAVDAIAEDFQIDLDRVIPVSLIPGAEYNVEESLLPAIGMALPEAERAKFLRLVELNRTADANDRLGKSIRLLVTTGRRLVDTLIR